MSYSSKLMKPSRKGKAWSDDEILQLLTSIRKKKTIDEISKIHQRTPGGIVSRLREIAADYYFNDHRPIEQIEKYTGLSTEVIYDAIEKRQWKLDHSKIENDEEPSLSLSEVMTLLKDLHKKMDIIIEHIHFDKKTK